MKFVNICGPVVADSVYSDNQLVARDVAVTLPEVTPMTADIQAMGTLSLPIWQLLEHMETAITKTGVDKGLGALIKPGMKPLEFRWVQTVTDANGTTKNVGCKAFIKGIPNKIPGIGLEVGATSEGEVTIATTRYALFVNGAEMFLIDRLAGIVRIDGVDYAGDLDAML
jgi:phage tail tube protein FII